MNRFLTRPPFEVVLSRLQVLLESVNSLYQAGGSITQDDLLSSYENSLTSFLNSLNNPSSFITKATIGIKEGLPADPTAYNYFMDTLEKELRILFLEIGSLDKTVSSSFNSIVALRQSVLNISKRIGNKIGNYLLYADPSLGAGYFFGDSFSSIERIDVGSDAVENEECYLNQEEGIILLPLDGVPTLGKVKSYTINKASNGNLGNNSELGVFGHNILDVIGDNNPDTWVEYERVVVTELENPLVLDLTIALTDLSIINHIHINPINFGTPTPVEIAILETSKDGAEYISIKDEVPIGDFVSEEEENVFSLSSATSKFSGEGFYSFLPRKVQYVHIVLKQYTPYTIDTTYGTDSRLRYAIGLRDINIYSRKFKTVGSLVSKEFSVSGEARKISFWASENPIEESKLANVGHEISHNNGAVWYPIQPQGRTGYKIPEIINFNNIAANSIVTDSPVSALRHKVIMERFPDAFNGNVTLKQEKISQVDIVDVPASSSPQIELTQEPIADTLRVILPFWGSFSCPRDRQGTNVLNESAPMSFDFVEFSVDVPANTGTIRYPLPYVGYPNLMEKLRVLVNGEQWQYCSNDDFFADGMGTTFNPIDENSKVYFLRKNGLELIFGFVDSRGTKRGMIPSAGARIQVCLDGDNPSIELTDQGYVIQLSASSDGIKENVKLVAFTSLDNNMWEIVKTVLPPGKIKADAIVSSSTDQSGINFSIVKEKPKVWSQSRSPYGKVRDKKIPFTKQWKKREYSILKDGDELPPIFLEGTDNFRIKEFTPGGEKVDGLFDEVGVPFVDGYTELVGDPNSYTFDYKTGNIYLGSSPHSGYETIFECKAIRGTIIDNNQWEYYKNLATGKIDTTKIILDPSVVFAISRQEKVINGDDKHKELTPDNTIAHSWRNQKIIKGTIKFKEDILGKDIKVTEVPFVDGESELKNIATVKETVPSTSATATNIHSYILSRLSLTRVLQGSPNFISVRTTGSLTVPVSQFLPENQKNDFSEIVISGNWAVEGYEVRVMVGAGEDLNSHIVTYDYDDKDTGLDTKGMYSVDYENGVIHFANKIAKDGIIYFDVTAYSAFYNIAEVVDEGDIEEVNEEEKIVKFSSAFGMKFLKLSTAENARPQYLKALYDYYKKTTESLKDIEAYFSPICKDIAIRAVTSDILEEL